MEYHFDKSCLLKTPTDKNHWGLELEKGPDKSFGMICFSLCRPQFAASSNIHCKSSSFSKTYNHSLKVCNRKRTSMQNFYLSKCFDSGRIRIYKEKPHLYIDYPNVHDSKISIICVLANCKNGM